MVLRFRLLLCFACMLLFSSSSDLIINIKEPVNNTVFALRSVDGDRLTISVRYDVTSLSSGMVPSGAALLNTQLCLQLDEVTAATSTLLPLTCFAASEESEIKTLTDIPIGVYQLQLLLRDTTPPHNTQIHSKVMSSFSIKKVADLLPAIVFTSLSLSSSSSGHRQIMYSAFKPGTSSTDVSIEYAVGSTFLAMDGFDLCVRVRKGLEDSGAEVLKLTCISSAQRALSLQAMVEGIYIVTLAFAHTQLQQPSLLSSPTHPLVYDNTKAEIEVHVVAVTDSRVLPSIVLKDEVLEVALASPSDKADAVIEFSILGIPSAVDLVQVCLQIDTFSYQTDPRHVSGKHIGSSSGSMVLSELSVPLVPLTCVPRHDTQVTVQGLGQGKHVVRLALRLIPSNSATAVANNPLHTDLLPGTEKTMSVELRAKEEFVPSYSWSLLHAWHTIPASIETRLAEFLIDYTPAISRILKPGLSLALLAMEDGLWHHSHPVQTVVKVVDAAKLGLAMGLTAVLPSLAPYLTRTDTVVAPADDNDDGMENHHYSDHTTTLVDPLPPHHPAHNSSSSSTSPSYSPSNSHLVVFWGVVAHLVVFFLSLMYQCYITGDPIAHHRSSLLGNFNGIDDDGNINNYNNIATNDDDDNVYLSR